MSTPTARTEPAQGPDGGGTSEPARLWVLLACEDAPKLCTGRRLVRLGLARELSTHARPPRGALLLDPHAQRVLGRGDAAAARRGGIVAVDCSWNRLGARGDFPEPLARSLRTLERRRLPFLLAANPQHYGRVGELNTAEAIGAALFLTCGREAAEAYFSRLAGGTGFLRLNEGPLADYASSTSDEEVVRTERSYFP